MIDLTQCVPCMLESIQYRCELGAGQPTCRRSRDRLSFACADHILYMITTAAPIRFPSISAAAHTGTHTVSGVIDRAAIGQVKKYVSEEVMDAARTA